MTLSGFKNTLTESFKANRFKFILKASILLFSFLMIVTLPIFTYRVNFNLLTNAFAIALAVCYFAYFVFFGELRLSNFSVSIIFFILESFCVTALTNFNISNWLSLFNILSISIVLFESVHLFPNKWLYPLFIYFGCLVLAGFVCLDNFHEIIALDFSRIGDKFGDVNAIGLIFSVGILFSFYLLTVFHNRFARIWLVLFIFAFLFLIFCTGSRGALLVAGCVILVYIYIYCLQRKKLIFFLLTLIILVGIAFLMLQIPVFADLKERLVGMLVSLLSGGEGGEGSASSRLYMLEEGLELWSMRPFFGNGYQSFQALSSQNTVSHSGLSELLCSFGLVGFVLWHLPIAVGVFSCRKTAIRNLVWTFAFGFVLPCLFPAIIFYAKMPMIAYAIIMGLFAQECIEQDTYAVKRIVFNRFDIVYRIRFSNFVSFVNTESGNSDNSK